MAEKFPRSRFSRGYNDLPGSTMWLHSDYTAITWWLQWSVNLPPCWSSLWDSTCLLCIFATILSNLWNIQGRELTGLFFPICQNRKFVFMRKKGFGCMSRTDFPLYPDNYLSVGDSGVAEKPVRGLASKSDQEDHFLQRCCWWFALLGHPRNL